MNEILEISELEPTLSKQRDMFREVPYRSYSQRIEDLKALKKLVLDNQQAFIDSMSNDFGHRSEDDSIVGDL